MEDAEKKLVFRYNREERIAKAPQLVKDYYDYYLVNLMKYDYLIVTPAYLVLYLHMK